MILQITIWTSLQRRCHKKFWLIRGTKWGEVKVKEAQPPLQLLRRHNLHHFQPRANPHHLSWVGGWSTSFIVLTGIVNDISLGAECCFPFQILWPLFIFSSTQPTTFSWYYLPVYLLCISLLFTALLCTPVKVHIWDDSPTDFSDCLFHPLGATISKINSHLHFIIIQIQILDISKEMCQLLDCDYFKLLFVHDEL